MSERKLWVGRQWVVTTSGIGLCEDPESYWIDSDRLQEGLGPGQPSHDSWPVHLAGKGWIDIEDFIAAFLIACYHLGVKSPRLSAVIAEARAKARAAAPHELQTRAIRAVGTEYGVPQDIEKSS